MGIFTQASQNITGTDSSTTYDNDLILRQTYGAEKARELTDRARENIFVESSEFVKDNPQEAFQNLKNEGMLDSQIQQQKIEDVRNQLETALGFTNPVSANQATINVATGDTGFKEVDNASKDTVKQASQAVDKTVENVTKTVNKTVENVSPGLNNFFGEIGNTVKLAFLGIAGLLSLVLAINLTGD